MIKVTNQMTDVNSPTPSRVLTLAALERADACIDQHELFFTMFGESVDVTEELCIQHAAVFNWNWAANNLLTVRARATYDAAIKSAGATYTAAVASARAAYAAVASARAARNAAVAAAGDAAVAAAWAAGDAAVEAAWAVYKVAQAAAWARAYIADVE